MARTVLITGASGFVGAHLCVGFAEKGWQVLAIGGKNACPEPVAEASKSIHSINLRVPTNVWSLISQAKPDLVIHSAALAQADACEKDPKLARGANVAATENIVDACNEGTSDGPVPLIFVSTDLVFDGDEAPAGGFLETELPEAASVYGKTKRRAEQIVHEKSTIGAIARICLVYGPSIGDKTGFLGWIRNGLEAKWDVTLFTDEWRTPVYVADICESCEAIGGELLELDELKPVETFHIAGPERISRYDFGMQFANLFGYDGSSLLAGKQSDHDSLAPRPRDVSLNADKISKRFGLSLKGVEAGLAAMKDAEC